MNYRKVAHVDNIQRVWLSNADAQKYLGVGPSFLENLRVTAQLPFYKIGKTIFYRVRDIDALIERNKVIDLS